TMSELLIPSFLPYTTLFRSYQFLGKHRLLLGPENTNRFAHYFEYEEQSPLLGSAELVSNMGDAVATLESQHHQTDMYPRYKRRTRPFPTRINSPPSRLHQWSLTVNLVASMYNV